MESSNKIASPHTALVESNFQNLKTKWRKHFALENNQVKCINKWLGNQKLVEMGEDISKSLSLHQRRNRGSFSLYFVDCSAVTEDGVKLFIRDILPQIKDIKDFKLKFHMHNGPKQNCYKVALQEVLRNLKKLESLTIDFHWTWRNHVLDDETLAFFAKELGKNQDNLKHLKIDLSSCKQITNLSLEVIGSKIGRRLCKLQSFTLNLAGGVKISNEALESICYGIAKYQVKLKKLCLDLSTSDSMNDEGLKLIVNAITKRFDQLEWLDLNFSKCTEITNDGLDFLSQTIGTSLPKLYHFKLGYQQCDQVTPMIRDILHRNLLHIPEMRFVF